MAFQKFIVGGKAVKAIALHRFTGRRTPLLASIFVTSQCNLKCEYCFVNTRQGVRKNFTKEEIFGIVDELHKMGTSVIDLMGGEPLMRKDIGEIIDYIKGKDIFCEILTNGYFVKQRLGDLKNVDSVCVSLDGDKNSHDENRGDGSYERAIEAIELLKKNGINTRIHMTLTKNNLNSLEYLVKLAQTYGVTLNVAQPIYDGAGPLALEVSDSDIKKFLEQLKKFVEEGYPIYNTVEALDYSIGWPYSYSRRLGLEDPTSGFRPLECKRKHLNCYIDANGRLYPCTAAYLEGFGLNVLEVGVEKAWDYSAGFGCKACGYFGEVEANMLFHGNLRSIIKAVDYSVGGILNK